MLNEKLLLGTPVHTREALKESVHIEQDRNLEDCRMFLLYSIYLKQAAMSAACSFLPTTPSFGWGETIFSLQHRLSLVTFTGLRN